MAKDVLEELGLKFGATIEPTEAITPNPKPPTPEIDPLEALARQHGGVIEHTQEVDEDALTPEERFREQDYAVREFTDVGQAGQDLGSLQEEYEGDIEPRDAFDKLVARKQTADRIFSAVEQEAPGIMEGLREQFTGEKRMLASTEALGDWHQLPEFHDLTSPIKGLSAAFSTTTADPKEIAQIMGSTYGLETKEDEKGNPLIKSNMDGKWYAVKPGFRANDAVRGLTTALLFMGPSKFKNWTSRILAEAGLETGIQAAQYGTGGTFDAGDILAGTAGGVGGEVVGKGMGKLWGAFKGGDQPLKAVDDIQVTPQQAKKEVDEMASAARAAGKKGRITKKTGKQLTPEWDEEIVRAAKEEGVIDYLAPDHMAKNRQYKEVMQAIKSVPGSELKEIEAEGLEQVGDQFMNLLKQWGADQGTGDVDKRLRDQMESMVEGLRAKENIAWEKLRAILPDETPVESEDLLAPIHARLKRVHGEKDRLTPIERKILKSLDGGDEVIEEGTRVYRGDFDRTGDPVGDYSAMSTSLDENVAKNFSSTGDIEEYVIPSSARVIKQTDLYKKILKVDKLPNPDTLTPEQLEKISGPNMILYAKLAGYDVIDQADNKTVSYGISMGNKPLDEKEMKILNPDILEKVTPSEAIDKSTYGNIDEFRKELGGIIAEGKPGIQLDMANHLYGKFADALDVAADSVGPSVANKRKVANALTVSRTKFEDDRRYLFGKKLDDSMVQKLLTATGGSLSKGDSMKLVKLINSVPKRNRSEVVASGIVKAFDKATDNGKLNFTSYANWWDGISANKQAMAVLGANLPKGAMKRLENIGKISQGIRSSTKRFISTGRVEAAKKIIEANESFLEQAFRKSKKASIMAPIEAVGYSIGYPGLSLLVGVKEAVSDWGKMDITQSLQDVMTSQPYRNIISESLEKVITEADAKKLAKTSQFKKLAKMLDISSPEEFIIGALKPVTKEVAEETFEDKLERLKQTAAPYEAQ